MQSHADRGVFRGFGRTYGRGPVEVFRFLWHGPEPVVMVFDPHRRTFSFPDLLPNIPYPSAMDRQLRAFVRGRTAETLPEHRRIDPRRARVRCTNRGGKVSVRLELKDSSYEYGVRKALKLVNEIFLSFLAGPYDHYMVETFGAPEE